MSLSSNICGACGAPDAAFACSRCKSARYCGKDCFRQAWKTHKTTCRVASDDVKVPLSSSSAPDETKGGTAEISSILGATSPAPCVEIQGDSAPNRGSHAEARLRLDEVRRRRDQANKLFKSKQVEEAIEILKSTLAENWGDEPGRELDGHSAGSLLRREVLELAAEAHSCQRQWWEVVSCVERALAHGPQTFRGNLLQGHALAELGLLHTSETALQRAAGMTTDAYGASELETCLSRVRARLKAIDDGDVEAISEEASHLRNALPEADADSWTRSTKLKCQTEKGRQELREHGFLLDSWTHDAREIRSLHKLLLYHVKKRLQTCLSMLGSDTGGMHLSCRVRLVSPRSCQHDAAESLLSDRNWKELQDCGFTVADNILDAMALWKLRKECEQVDKYGALQVDPDDVCNPLQRCYDVPLDDKLALERSRAQTPVLLDVVERLRGLPQLFEDRLGLRLRVPQTVMLACYPCGAFYRKHLDSYAGKDNPRKVTVLFYCNPSWSESDGGYLRVWVNGECRQFAPTGGRLIIFMSQDVWHEVLESKKERYALTLWVWDTKPDELGR